MIADRMRWGKRSKAKQGKLVASPQSDYGFRYNETRVVNNPTPWIRDMLLAVVAFHATHGRGARAKLTAAGSHAVARRMAFGTETVGFLKLAIFGLRALEHPACAVALTTEMIAVHASRPPLRTALPFSTSASVFVETPEAFRELCRWDIPSLRAGSAPARYPSPSSPLVYSPVSLESPNRSETSPWWPSLGSHRGRDPDRG